MANMQMNGIGYGYGNYGPGGNGHILQEFQRQQEELKRLLLLQTSSSRPTHQIRTSTSKNIQDEDRPTLNFGTGESVLSEEFIDRSLLQVSHGQLDRKIFRKRHPWSVHCEQMYGILEGIRSLGQIDDLTIVRAIGKYIALNYEDEHRNRLLSYCLNKTPTFSSTNKSGTASSKELSANSSILKGLVNSVDMSFEAGKPLTVNELNAMAIDFRMTDSANSRSKYPEASTATGNRVRGNHGGSTKSGQCFAYNRTSGCRKKADDCEFEHSCQSCGKKGHPAFKCHGKTL